MSVRLRLRRSLPLALMLVVGPFGCGASRPLPAAGDGAAGDGAAGHGVARCGDGKVDPGEECDDGNDLPLDGCESTCIVSAVEKVVNGEGSSCALCRGGIVRCWGENADGQLGLGHTHFVGNVAPYLLKDAAGRPGVVDLGGTPAIDVSAGTAFACALLADGTVRCWGKNDTGQLGLGNTTPMPTQVGGPVDLGPGASATAVVASHGYACALLSNGGVRCWGDNLGGLLGLGSAEPVLVADVSLGGATATAVAVGENNACAILSGGSVACWGDNTFGELGLGSTAIADSTTVAPSGYGTVGLAGGRTAVGLAAGSTFNCARLDDGQAECWGYNQFGELGIGSTAAIGDDELPGSAGLVALGDAQVTALAAGYDHTCALVSGVGLKCWGGNASGELGQGDTVRRGAAPSSLPADIPAIRFPLGLTPRAVSAGNGTTCALLSDGSVRCWGWNDRGQLGYGAVFDAQVAPRDDVGGLPGETPDQLPPVQIIGTPAPRNVCPPECPLTHAVQLAAGRAHTCALFDSGRVRCWGANDQGQLGAGDTRDRTALPPYQNPLVDLGGGNATFLTAGADHTCALMDDGSVRCWGANGSGQLGLGNTDDVGDDETPAAVSPIALGIGVTAVAAGGDCTCALLADRTVRCWGDNRYGQLGLGHTDDIGDDELPTREAAQVSLGADAALVATGGYFSCAIFTDQHHGVCWGQNARDELGLGMTQNVGDNELPSSVPPFVFPSNGVVPSPYDISSLVVGAIRSCALMGGVGMPYCWGDNDDGGLGIEGVGTDTTRTVTGWGPFGLEERAADMAAGGYHVCMRLDDARLRCWGENLKGQLGLANTDTLGDAEPVGSVPPIDLGTGADGLPSLAAAVTAGYKHTCVILTDERVLCWGANESGQLGLGYASPAPMDFVGGTPESVPAKLPSVSLLAP